MLNLMIPYIISFILFKACNLMYCAYSPFDCRRWCIYARTRMSKGSFNSGTLWLPIGSLFLTKNTGTQWVKNDKQHVSVYVLAHIMEHKVGPNVLQFPSVVFAMLA